MSKFTRQKRRGVKTNLTRKQRQLPVLEQILQFFPANRRSVFVADRGCLGREVRTKTRTSIFSFEVSGHGNWSHANTDSKEKIRLIFPAAVMGNDGEPLHRECLYCFWLTFAFNC